MTPDDDATRDGAPVRVLIVTVVHDPEDARIRYRELGALLDCEIVVGYAAPFRAYGRTPPAGVEAIDLPRAIGRHRFAAIRAARRLLQRAGPRYDVVLLHDPELLLTVPGLPAGKPLVVWDVHEDTAAALGMKTWLPEPLRPVTALAVQRLERWAERRCALLLAEESYAGRFRHEHAVVPNTVLVPRQQPPPSGHDRVVYLGRLTRPRGALEMIELGRQLAPGITVDLIGPADREVAAQIAAAHREGWVHHRGFVPNEQALDLLRGALAGLSLLHDEPNYATSRPTKVIEYMAFGVPVVTTPNHASADLVRRYRNGIVVPFRDPRAAADAVRHLRDDRERRQSLADAGRAAALRDLDWRVDGERFGRLLRAWAMASRTGP